MSIQESILYSNDIMSNICYFIKDDINCLVNFTETNKQINDIIINNPLFLSKKECIINNNNYNKMFRYIKFFSESKIFKSNNNSIEYFSKIKKLIPNMVSSHLYDLNVELCLNFCYINYWKNNNSSKYIYLKKFIIEEAKILYYIIKKINPLYKIVITPSNNYIIKFDNNDLIKWCDNLTIIEEYI